MSDFKRENRYTVIKHNQLTDSQSGHLKDFLLGEGVPTVKSVVIESDWPEYEPVWSMIERRMSGKPEHVGVIVAKKWLEGAPRAVSLINGSDLPDSAYLYLAPPASSDLAEATLQILKEAKDIPDGLYARAKHLSISAQSELAALREELAKEKERLQNLISLPGEGNTKITVNAAPVMKLMDERDQLKAEEKSLRQRLADAERRNAELQKVLSPFAKYAANAGWLPPFSVRCSKGLFAITSDDWQAVAALKPTESGASAAPAKPKCHWSCTGCDICGSAGHGNSWS